MLVRSATASPPVAHNVNGTPPAPRRASTCRTAARVSMRAARAPRAMLPGYAFIKTFKVGGTTVTSMLQRTLRETQNTTRCDDNNQTTKVMRPPPPGCRACLTHISHRQIAAALCLPKLPAAQAAVRKMCPFWVPGRHVHTMVMLREPVDRLHSRYHYERSSGWCRKKATALGLSGCASDHYAFAKWAFVSPVELGARRLYSAPRYFNHAETVVTLGGRGGVVQALRVLKKIEVVGLTHRFNETLRALSIYWGLPLFVLKRQFAHFCCYARFNYYKII